MVKVIGRDTDFGLGRMDGAHHPVHYPVIVQLPGPEEQKGVIYWRSYMRFPKNKAADALRKAEIAKYDIPSLEMRPGPVDWMWIVIERWLMTWRTERHQIAKINTTQIGRMNKLKNQRTR